MEENKHQGTSGFSGSNLREKLQGLRPWPTECCIYKVPAPLRSINESAYTSRVVSIGPLHHGAAKLQEMEVHKHMYLNLLLNRNPNITLEGLIKVVRGLCERARNCYEDEFTRYLTSDQFVDIMLLDSCFILAFFLLWMEHFARDENDAMFKGKHLRENVLKDLILLENQVPFFILEQLYNFIIPSNQPHAFLSLAIACFWQWMQEDQCLRLESSDNQQHVKHIVDLILKCNFPCEVYQMPTTNDINRIELPSATEIRNQMPTTNDKNHTEIWVLSVSKKLRRNIHCIKRLGN